MRKGWKSERRSKSFIIGKVKNLFDLNCEPHSIYETLNFVDYKITVVTPIRTYTMDNRENAPKDSNEYFEVK